MNTIVRPPWHMHMGMSHAHAHAHVHAHAHAHVHAHVHMSMSMSMYMCTTVHECSFECMAMHDLHVSWQAYWGTPTRPNSLEDFLRAPPAPAFAESADGAPTGVGWERITRSKSACTNGANPSAGCACPASVRCARGARMSSASTKAKNVICPAAAMSHPVPVSLRSVHASTNTYGKAAATSAHGTPGFVSCATASMSEGRLRASGQQLVRHTCFSCSALPTPTLPRRVTNVLTVMVH
jgi:hypothetical protein